jgi:hypothetical protein
MIHPGIEYIGIDHHLRGQRRRNQEQDRKNQPQSSAENDVSSEQMHSPMIER